METVTSTASIGSSILTSLSSGSGIDSAALAQNLTNAQKAPQEALIQGNINETTAEISGYGLISYQLAILESSFNAINDADEVTSGSGTSSDMAKVSFNLINGAASTGSYGIKVDQLAQNQSVMSNQYSAANASINNGVAFDIQVSVGTTVLGTFQEELTTSTLQSALANGGSITVTDDSNNAVTVTQAEVNAVSGTIAGNETLTAYVTALKAKIDASSSFNFSVSRSYGAIIYTQTVAGTGNIVSATDPITVGVPSVTPQAGVAAIYSSGTVTPAQTTLLAVSDGATTVSVDSASYSNVASQVTAIQSALGYDDLLFTVAENAGNIEFTYKTMGAVTTAPTLTTTAGIQTLTNPTVGVTAVNSPITTTVQITAGADTPEGIVTAINAAQTGVTANLVDTGTDGSNYRIVLSGQQGSDNQFSLSSTPNLGFSSSENSLQVAQNAEFEVNGVTVSRGSNEVSDVVTGVTFSLNAVSTDVVTLIVSKDTTPLKTNIIKMVENFNAFNNMLDSLTQEPAEGVELSGSLAGDKTLTRFLSDQLRTAILGDSSTASGPIKAMRDIGVSIDRYGQLTFDESTFDTALATHYDDVVTMLTANTNNQSALASGNKGLSQDLTNLVVGFTDNDGVVYNHLTAASVELADYKQDLAELEIRMEGIYIRYITQFAAMDALVASINNTKNYLTTQLENMADSYWKN